MGDDGFGVAVVQQLSKSNLPTSVRVVDFGIRGLDLAYALQNEYETTILIDAFPNGQSPGTVSVVEPDLNDSAGSLDQGNFLEPHAMNPMHVLRMTKTMQGRLNRILLVGCEPATLGGEDGSMGLSSAVKIAVHEAVKVIESLVEKTLDKGLKDTIC
jgi:hydrogenase maturation protease